MLGSSASLRHSNKLKDPMLQVMMSMCVKAGVSRLYLSICFMPNNEKFFPEEVEITNKVDEFTLSQPRLTDN